MKIQVNSDRLFNVYKFIQCLAYEHCYKKRHISKIDFQVCLDMIKGIIDEQTR